MLDKWLKHVRENKVVQRHKHPDVIDRNKYWTPEDVLEELIDEVYDKDRLESIIVICKDKDDSVFRTRTSSNLSDLEFIALLELTKNLHCSRWQNDNTE